jgi:hypothetical protein
LRAWQLDGRLGVGSEVVEQASGRVLGEEELSRLLDPGSQAPSLRPEYVVRPQSAEPVWPIVSVVLWSAAALVLFFVFRGWGFIIAAFTLFDAYRLKSRGSKYGNAALAVAVATAVVIAWGWYDRTQGGDAGGRRPPATEAAPQ